MMKKLNMKKQGAKRLGGIKRKSVNVSPDNLVRLGHLPGLDTLPLLIEPTLDGVNLLTWAADQQAYINELLWQHHALLFRGFGVNTVEAFEEFVSLTSQDKPLEYKDRSTPRTSRGTGSYTSTIHPADQRINLHNEGTYWLKWAMKLYFCCTVPATTGGETPLANANKVYERLEPTLRQKFIDKKMMLVRNYNDGFGLPWQEVYQTENKAEVETYCRDHLIEFEWKAGDRFRTKQIRPAVRLHPKTGQFVWFNHAAFFHYTTLEPAVREALVAEFGLDDLPYNTYYGDGDPITPDEVEHVRQAYEQEKVMFQWQEGDVLLLDNMTIAHAREPYQGGREILAAMTEAYSGVESE